MYVKIFMNTKYKILSIDGKRRYRNFKLELKCMYIQKNNAMDLERGTFFSFGSYARYGRV